MNVPNFPEGQRPKATDVSPWAGFTAKGFRATAIEFFTPSRLNEARTSELLESGTLDQSPISALFEIR
jgi:hypothetical protein